MVRTSNPDVERFDRWAATYDQWWLQRWYFGPVHAAMLDLLAHHGPAEAPHCILDVGCGTGRLMRAAGLRWPRAQLLGVDPAEQIVAQARRLTPSATMHVAPAEALPVPDQTVDLVVSSLSFHHWTDQARGLQEIARVLRPGGWFCLADHTRPRWLARRLRPRVRTLRSIEALIRGVGLSGTHHERLWARFVVIILAEKHPASPAAA
jgi:ubiquinone/menaquinone biosynthesis C-methylase UbiE